MIKIGKFETRDFIILGIIFFVLNLFDIHSIYLGIKQTGIEGEGNPLMKYLIGENPVLAVFLKLVLALGIVFVCMLGNKSAIENKKNHSKERCDRERKLMSISMLFGLFLMSTVVVSNYLGVLFDIAVLNFIGVILTSFTFLIFLVIFT